MAKHRKRRTDEKPENGEVPRANRLRIRQAFYDGVASICLRDAWQHLNTYREKKIVRRYFRGQMRDRELFPLADIAAALCRNTGEICRWFQNTSPDWANLVMVMSVLDADWEHLRLPPKHERKGAGIRRALKFIRHKVLGAPPPTQELVEADCGCLDDLSADPRWIIERQIPHLRLEALNRVAKRSGRSVSDVERVDRDWGNAFVYWLTSYGLALDEMKWR